MRLWGRALVAALVGVSALAGAGRAAERPVQEIIAEGFPEIGKLRRAIMPELRALEDRLSRAEEAGADTSCLRQAIVELRWRLNSTGDAPAAAANWERIRSWAAMATPPSALVQADDGSFGACVTPWFLKLDTSADHLLATNPEPLARSPRFLDAVNDPERLRAYLEDLPVSRPAQEGIDRRKELNDATADLLRLILRHRPADYPWDPRLEAVIRGVIARWQDPETGFFGETYELGDRRYRSTDLSLTFHMASYLDGKIGHWPELADTLFRIRDDRYPDGWLDAEGMTSHNNYDVVLLFSLGWSEMRGDQRQHAAAEIGRLLDWCLGTAIAPDGTVVARAVGESLPESYYFTLAFLDTVGYFNPKRRFWTDRSFPEALELRAKLKTRVLMLDQRDPMTRGAMERFAD